MEIDIVQAAGDSSVSSFGVAHCSFFPSFTNDAVNKLSFLEAINACIEVEIMSTLNLYPALHLQVPVLVSFEYE
ncbi:hypothetical protein BAZSYMA_ACONTIG228273_1 [Bathymodiolus azoricus thioautotrophic gill symbiont]|uniref:Uncharacterized protein n=1 Tax=Bathymodiolus azoricus thioautotrophic gill symbiont TaxID=235205 RepID=A0A1H6MQ50_9GAMM|nr:hypothetical protein BAZSYMA_ACONTIG228273_1 [Bathymodiolus azoricus thioautotrophic gill symbiont]